LEGPVIAVFTKYDQFLIDVGIDFNLEDRKDEDPSIDISEEATEKATRKFLKSTSWGP